MATSEDERKVRPIDFEPDESSNFFVGEQLRADRDPSAKRPWLALAFSAVAVLVVVGLVSAFGALEFADPQRETPETFTSGDSDVTESTTETLPPRLEDSLPNLTDRLTLIVIADDHLQTLLWDPSFRVPRPYDLPIDNIDRATNLAASFDSGGRMLAISVTTSKETKVYLGVPTDIGSEPDLIGASSVIWHASEVGAISWTTRTAEGDVELHTGKVNPLSGSITNDETITSFDKPVGLVRWDSSGFVLNKGSSVVALDPAGEPLWEQVGVAVSGSASIVTLIAPDDSASETRWLVIDRATGEPSLESITGAPKDVWVTASRDTDLIAQISASEERTRILVDGPEISARRIVQVDIPVVPIGFSSSGEYIQFSAFDANDLVFVNWRTGATHTVPIPDEYQIIATDLG